MTKPTVSKHSRKPVGLADKAWIPPGPLHHVTYTTLGNRLYAWHKGPNVTNPICWTLRTTHARIQEYMRQNVNSNNCDSANSLIWVWPFLYHTSEVRQYCCDQWRLAPSWLQFILLTQIKYVEYWQQKFNCIIKACSSQWMTEPIIKNIHC